MSFNISNPSFLGKRPGQPMRAALQQRVVQRPSLLERFRAWRATRAAEAELFALSDHDLKDIGVSRFDIRAAVRGTVGRQ
jgi:uncharacterized protein YjiS (DUF1127 family)